MSTPLSQGRYLLFIDILGFSKRVESQPAEEIYAVVNSALETFQTWERLNGLFRTIYFSDSFIFYQEPKGYGRWAFLDIYAIGGMVLSALLAAGIPARGSIAFGQFEVNADTSARHQIYFGKALIEAYKAEQKEKWIGITILPSAWMPFEAESPGTVDAFANERVWARRNDNVLLLNPFIKLKTWFSPAFPSEIDKPYSLCDAPEFPNDIRAFKFLREEAASYAAKNDFSSPEAVKYHTTIRFLESVLGEALYAWGVEASAPANFLPAVNE